MTKIGHIEILDTKTNETVRSDELLGKEFDSYHWTEGNESCDCNRILFFLRAKGFDTEEELDRGVCYGDDISYRVKVYDLEGSLLFDDTENSDSVSEMAEA